MKLIIGSAQFGFKYGYKKKKINKNQYPIISNIIKKNSLFRFDTAMNYRESEEVIGRLRFKKNIITKLKLPRSKPKNLKTWVEKKINQSLKKLKIKQLYGLLIHDVNDLLNYSNKLLLILNEFKKKKIISKLGISVYEVREINKVLKLWKPDIIQMPVNIFDQRFIKKKILNKLKKKNIEIHSRSCFLQGQLLEKELKVGNNNNKKLFKKFTSWCKKNKFSQLTACLHFIKKIKQIDYLIVGFENSIQLEEIISSFNKKLIHIPNIFHINEKKIIDPRKW